MRRACDICGMKYEAKSSRARYCGDACRKRARRGGNVVPFKEQARPSVADAVRTELDDAGRTGSSLGQTALALALRLDAGGDTGSAVAALTKELRATLDAALRDGKAAADPLDELRQRREERLRAN